MTQLRPPKCMPPFNSELPQAEPFRQMHALHNVSSSRHSGEPVSSKYELRKAFLSPKPATGREEKLLTPLCVPALVWLDVTVCRALGRPRASIQPVDNRASTLGLGRGCVPCAGRLLPCWLSLVTNAGTVKRMERGHVCVGKSFFTQYLCAANITGKDAKTLQLSSSP